MGLDVLVDDVRAAAYEVPTDEPESDGTLQWDSTTIVVVEIDGADTTGLGYTYADASVARLVTARLGPLLAGARVSDIAARWIDMSRALRNAGRPGAGMMAISAVDVALWDLKARLLDLPLVELLHPVHAAVPIYGSGGFTSYTLDRIESQLGGWVEAGIPRVKMKVGRVPEEDPVRLDAARKAIGEQTALFVDANGGLSRKQALYWAERFHQEWDVSWFEEPVSSDDLEGLRLVRDRAPGGIDIAAGEYGFLFADFRELVERGAVDCLQADVTRCGGITALVRISGVCDAHGIDLSGHCAPAISAHALVPVMHLRHLEYFHDHVRLESMLFDGTPEPQDGCLRPDRDRPGHGLTLKRAEAERYRVA